MILFPVWVIKFSVLKTNFEFLGRNREGVGKEVFFIIGPEVGEIIPCPVWKIPFHVLKINFGLL